MITRRRLHRDGDVTIHSETSNEILSPASTFLMPVELRYTSPVPPPRRAKRGWSQYKLVPIRVQFHPYSRIIGAQPSLHNSKEISFTIANIVHDISALVFDQ